MGIKSEWIRGLSGEEGWKKRKAKKEGRKC